MAYHTIRLRAGWLLSGDPPGEIGSRRVELPGGWAPAGTGGFRLTRIFRRPPIDPARERIELRLADAPGVAAVWLNDRPLVTAGCRGGESVSIPLPAGLPARNELVLRVETPPCEPAAPWGDIALVIHAAEASVAPG